LIEREKEQDREKEKGETEIEIEIKREGEGEREFKTNHRGGVDQSNSCCCLSSFPLNRRIYKNSFN